MNPCTIIDDIDMNQDLRRKKTGVDIESHNKYDNAAGKAIDTSQSKAALEHLKANGSHPKATLEENEVKTEENNMNTERAL